VASLAPVDYVSGLGRLPNPLRDIQEQMAASIGLRRGQLANDQQQIENQGHQGELDQRQAFQRDMEQALLHPTPENFSNVIANHPEYAQQVKQAWDVRDHAERQSELTQMGEIYSAARNGQWQLAAAALKRRIAADRAAGHEDPQDAAMLAALESSNPVERRAALGMIGTHLAILTGPDHMAGAMEQIGVDPERKGQVVGRAIGHYDESGKWVTDYRDPDPPQYRELDIVGPDGQTHRSIVAVGGSEAGAGGASASGGRPARGVRNNNPGNIEDGPFARSQPGYKGSDGRFAVFDTPEQGQAATQNLLRSYIKRGNNTPAAIVGRWAPAGENGASTNNYAAYVARRLGIGPNDPIPPGRVAEVAQAMHEFENGQQQGAGAAGGGPRVAAMGAPTGGNTYRTLTPAEVSAIPGLDPNTVYQQSPTGQITAVGGQSRSQLKPWPATALSARTTNQAALTNIEGALRLFDPSNNSQEARIARGAIGPGTGLLGDTFTQWNNPEGTDARARVGQIGGLIIKDVSGAAVTLSEDQRLAKWVPLVTDRPEVVRAKLANLKREIAQRNAAMDDTYSQDQGYRPFKASGPPVRVRSVQEAQRLPSGTVFITPDGQTRRKR
jgi:hypothetical protein